MVEVDIDVLAQLLVGLMVPRSMGMLGTATEAYDQMRDRFGLFGWQDKQQVKERIEQYVWNSNT